MRLRLRILGSSSQGNCAILTTRNGVLMIDCGFGAAAITEGLRGMGLDWEDLSGVLLTHLHGDHVRQGALRRAGRAAVPIVAPPTVLGALGCRTATPQRLPFRCLAPCEPSAVGDFEVMPIPVPHDAVGGCYAYRISGGSGRGRWRAGYATDVGYPTRGLEEALAGSDLLILESNHDVLMLERSNRPRSLKIRIRSHGHLSNVQSADLLSGICHRSPRAPEAVVLAHLSQECNTPAIALRAAGAALLQHARREVSLWAAPPAAPGLTLLL